MRMFAMRCTQRAVKDVVIHVCRKVQEDFPKWRVDICFKARFKGLPRILLVEIITHILALNKNESIRNDRRQIYGAK